MKTTLQSCICVSTFDFDYDDQLEYFKNEVSDFIYFDEIKERYLDCTAWTFGSEVDVQIVRFF